MPTTDPTAPGGLTPSQAAQITTRTTARHPGVAPNPSGGAATPVGDALATVLPFYLVADVSMSMQGEPLDALNRAQRDLADTIAIDPVVADKTRFSIITFSDAARVALPLCDLGDLDPADLPELRPEGRTSYAAAFRLLREQIDDDVDAIKAAGGKVYRPAVFFFSDGQPTDPAPLWKPSVAAVHDPSWRRRPNIITFGLGSADTQVIGAIATVKAFAAAADADPGAAITEFARSLTKSIMASGRADGARLIPPTHVEGAREVDHGIDLDEV